MLLDTYDVLDNRGLISNYGIAKAIRERLQSEPVGSIGEVDSKALLVEEIVAELFGDGFNDEVAEELRELVQDLTRPSGMVHQSMRDGFVLCSAHVVRKVTSEHGKQIVVRGTGRFVTQEAEVAYTYRYEPAIARHIGATVRLGADLSEGQARLPGLKKFVPELTRRVHQSVQAELPAPQQNGGKP